MNARRTFLLTVLAALSTACSEREISLSDVPDFDIVEVKKGSGVPAKMGDQITAEYTLTLPDGTVLVDITGFKSHTWTIGDETVIVGVDESVIGMRPGGIRKVTLPPDLHYGEDGYADGVVPPDTTLTLRIKLSSVH